MAQVAKALKKDLENTTVSNPVEAVVMCKCQDSDGNVCGREMTNQEQDQDGMCWHCADSVWNELTSNDTVKWKHSDRVDGNYT